jgi:hypothetical protein
MSNSATAEFDWAALWAAAPGSAGGHKARPYAMHFLQI